MADNPGYTIVQNAVPAAFIQQVVDEMDRGLKVSKPGAKFTEYSPPKSAQAVRDEFVKVGITALGKFFAPNGGTPILKSVNVGTFHRTTPDPSKRGTGAKGQVYVTIALTELNSETGWFDFLEGSHRRTPGNTSISEWKKASLKLSAGDAVIWRGDLLFLYSPGGGGKFQTLVFEGS